VLRGGFEPIEITKTMVDLVIAQHRAQATYVGCLRGRGRTLPDMPRVHGRRQPTALPCQRASMDGIRPA
jgi:hypothetical protein